jgi:DNA-binding NarL/FixJ family response regulator
MTRVYLANAKTEECSAISLLLYDMKMDLVGEGKDWSTTLAQAPVKHVDMLLVDWDVLPLPPRPALAEFRKACPRAQVIVLTSLLEGREQAALSYGADAFISRAETPERVAERLRVVAARGFVPAQV